MRERHHPLEGQNIRIIPVTSADLIRRIGSSAFKGALRNQRHLALGIEERPPQETRQSIALDTPTQGSRHRETVGAHFLSLRFVTDSDPTTPLVPSPSAIAHDLTSHAYGAVARRVVNRYYKLGGTYVTTQVRFMNGIPRNADAQLLAEHNSILNELKDGNPSSEDIEDALRTMGVHSTTVDFESISLAITPEIQQQLAQLPNSVIRL